MKSANLITDQAYKIIAAGGTRADYVLKLLGATAD